jgi:hypothetical protein
MSGLSLLLLSAHEPFGVIPCLLGTHSFDQLFWCLTISDTCLLILL